MGIVQEHGIIWKTAADVPESSREAAARFALWPFTKEEPCQPIPGLRLAAMADQISEQRLRFKGRRIGQLTAVAADLQGTQKV
jgi:hypothetical protein